MENRRYLEHLKEKEKVEVGLACFLQGMYEKKIYVELRNNNYVFGYLEHCDSFLNMRIRRATVIRNATSEKAEEFFVAGRHVRFVHFEHNVDAQAVIRRYLKNGNLLQIKHANRRLDQSQSNSGKQNFPTI